MKNIHQKEYSAEKITQTNGSNVAKKTSLILALALAAGGLANAQTIMNKNKAENMIENERAKINNIGNDVAGYLYGGGMHKFIQTEWEKQNNEHGKNYTNDEFNLFEKEEIESLNKDSILNIQELYDTIKNSIGEMVTADMVAFYIAFHQYQAQGDNLIGNKKGKNGVLPAGKGWTILGFPFNPDIAFLGKNKDIPFTPEEQEKLEKELMDIYKGEIGIRLKNAEKNRKSMTPAEYESADLIALEETNKRIIEKIWNKIVKKEIDQTTKEYYSNPLKQMVPEATKRLQ